jgi:hypothetical protein
MTNDRREKIVKDHPLLFIYPIYFECGEGWLDIIERLAAKLEEIIKKNKSEAYSSMNGCTQVKEKYGTIRFYMDYYNEEIEKAIDEARIESSITCEVCGKNGKLQGTYWYKTVCEDHQL